MTATTAPISDPPSTRTPALRSARRSARAADAVAWSITVAALLVAYLVLQNPYWVPGGDSEVYTAIARNLAIGKGYTFNGQPVSMVPPGWCWFLAGAMKIEPTFLLLKLLTMGCMLGSLALMYWVCRRFAGPALSAIVILSTGILSHVYSLTFWLHSDALFCLVSAAALLIAMQINEGRPHRWRIPLLVALCIISVIVRWAGIFTWLTVAAALVDGQLKLRVNRYWVTLLVSGAMTAATFFSLRWALTVAPEIDKQVKQWVSDDPGAGLDKADKNLAMGYSIFNPAQGGIAGYIGRGFGWGNWFSYLLWQPLRLGRSSTLINLVSLLIGWTVLVPLLIQGWRSLQFGQWLWIAVLLYSFALAMNWPHPNARYLVPIAPLIVLGVFKGFEVVRQRWPAPAVATTAKVMLGYFVASIFLCNGALYAVDAAVARSDDFYRAYEAGLSKDLIYAAKWLNEHAPADGEIGVCEYYINLGKPRISRVGLRATTMLTGKAIVSVPKKYLARGDPRRNKHFLAWARALGVKYVLYQPEVSPWRVFHFRMGWLQEAMTGAAAIDSGAGWRLYEIPPAKLDPIEAEFDEAIRISLVPEPNWPMRVPGLEPEKQK